MLFRSPTKRRRRVSVGKMLSERLSDRVSMIESLFACDREVQDKERSKIIRNRVCLIDK